MLLYAWIAWNLIGGIVSAQVIKNQVKKNEREDDFYEDCNGILEVLRVNSRDYFDLYHGVCCNRRQLDNCLIFLIDNNLVEYIPESHRYYLVKKER